MSSSHEIKLDIFEGPLDLLLYLIQKNDLDIYDISISKITSEYLAYIELLKEMKLDVAGEFLVMASTLMQIKARTLLPSPKSESDEGPDPRAELINRLLEYQRYKVASKDLEKRLVFNREVHYRGAPVFAESDFHLEASLFDLLDAFRDVLEGLKPEVREIFYEEVPIEVKIREILSFIESKPFTTFRDIMKRESTRKGLIATFLAVLELIRLRQIVARQTEIFGEIRVYRAQDLANEPEPTSQEETEMKPSSLLPVEETDSIPNEGTPNDHGSN